MALVAMETVRRVANYAEKTDKKCMNCGKDFNTGTGLYAKRFCSEECRLKYLGIY